MVRFKKNVNLISFFERTERAAVDERKSQLSSVIIPGDRGKVGPGWLVRLLITAGRKAGRAEAEFTSSSGGVRALPVNAIKEHGSQAR